MNQHKFLESTNGLGIHVEITSNCNSRCLDCGRYVKGSDTVNPYVDTGSKGNISIQAIRNIFDDEVCKTARYVNFTGTYGDFTLHPQAIEIIETIANHRRKNNSQPLIFMAETNGGIRDNEWWHNLAKSIKNNYDVRKSLVIFGIDGADNETHQMYRRGVDFDTVLRHAKILIDNGIRCRWSFIAFDHNEHQIEEAQQMSKEHGFTQFRIRRSRLRHNSKKIFNLEQKKKNISDKELNRIGNMYKGVVEEVKDKGPSTWSKMPPRWYEKEIDPYVNETTIECEWKKKNQISIDYTGRVWQCCYFSNFYHYSILPTNVPYMDKYDFNDETRKYERLDVYESRYKENWNNVNYHTLTEIVGHDFFTNDLEQSFGNDTEHKTHPRIVRCTKFCGSKARNNDKLLSKMNESKLNAIK